MEADLFSHSSPTFIPQNERLLKDRSESICGLIMVKDGQHVAAIVGGNKKSMETRNPTTKWWNWI